MTTARGQVVIAVENRQPLGIKESAHAQRVQHTFKKFFVPSIEQVAGDGEMLRGLYRDRIKLAVERGEIPRIPEVKVG